MTVISRAFPIANRARIGTSTFRADFQSASGIDGGDGAAPRADGVNVDHGNLHRVAAEVRFRGEWQLTVDQGDVGGGATHVEADQPFESRDFADFEGAHRAARWPRENRADRFGLGGFRGNAAAVGLHDAETAATQMVFQKSDVAPHLGRDVGVDNRRRGALVLAEFCQGLVGEGNGDAQFQNFLAHHSFVFRVFEREEQRDGNRFDLGGFQRRQKIPDLSGIECFEDVAGRIDPTIQPETEGAGNQGGIFAKGKVVKNLPVLAGDFNHILKPRVGDQGRFGSFFFQDRIGSYRRAVNEFEIAVPSNVANAGKDCFGGIGRGGKGLVFAPLAAVLPDEVGEGPASVNTNDEHEILGSFIVAQNFSKS